jgi:hypothetical protein
MAGQAFGVIGLEVAGRPVNRTTPNGIESNSMTGANRGGGAISIAAMPV